MKIIICLSSVIAAAVATNNGASMKVVSPSYITCPKFESKCCREGLDSIDTRYANDGNFFDFDSYNEVTYCNHDCAQEGSKEVVGPAEITCPLDFPYHCKDSEGFNIQAIIGDDYAIFSLFDYFEKARCWDECTVEEKSTVLVGPAKAECFSSSDCRSSNGDILNSTKYTTSFLGTEMYKFNVPYGKTVRCNKNCDHVENSTEIKGPATVNCTHEAYGCYNSNNQEITNGWTATNNGTYLSVPQMQVYRCDSRCKVEESSFDVAGPARITCPSNTSTSACVRYHNTSRADVVRTASGSYFFENNGTTTYRCKDSCIVNDTVSANVSGPFEITCPSNSYGCQCPSGYDCPSITSRTLSNGRKFYSTDSIGEYRCSPRCDMNQTSLLVVGPASVTCYSDKQPACKNAKRGDGLSSTIIGDRGDYDLECGVSAYCLRSCSVDGDAVDPDAVRYQRSGGVAYSVHFAGMVAIIIFSVL